MKKRTILYAEDGMVLTNGTVYGKEVLLADGTKEDSFWEIPESAMPKEEEDSRV